MRGSVLNNLRGANRSRYLLVLIALSAVFTLLRGGPLRGSVAALLLVVAFELVLPGILWARLLGKLSGTHPVTRMVWVLACGLSFTVCFGALARLLHMPITTYLVLLHVLMAVLALWPKAYYPPETEWRMHWRSLPFYLLLALCCGAALFVGYERSRIRFDYYEDQTVFIEQANWLANAPDDPGLRSRRVGVQVGDPRADSDGWTYTHAAWDWTSGVPAADIIWQGLTPLLVWTIPLVTFALAFELTRREDMATWSAAALTIVALLTLDRFVYMPNEQAFGASAFFQLNTLRTMSRALMLPIVLFTGLAFLRTRYKRDLIPLALAALALASMHIQQLMVFGVVAAATALIVGLAQPSRRDLKRVILALVVLTCLGALAFVQRQRYMSTDFYAEGLELYMQSRSVGAAPTAYLYAYHMLYDLPILGSTYIVNPDYIFYHPVIVVVVALGLAAVVRWRKSFAAQYVFASTAAVVVLLFVPGVTRLFARLTFVPAVPGLVFGLPIAAAFGLAITTLHHWLERVPIIGRSMRWLITAVLAVVISVMLLEPIPFSGSARDQIRSANAVQSLRAMLPDDQQLLDSLNAHLPADQRSILIAPNRVANFIVESVPHTLITGGRGSNTNVTFVPTLRFYGNTEFGAPFLDSVDVAFINQWNVSHIVMEADDMRLPQLLLQPERFELLDTPAGYWVFAVQSPLADMDVDARFAEMNALYAQLSNPRWDFGDFHLEREANAEAWQDITAAWETALEQAPDNDTVRYGLAFSSLMMANDERALPMWRELHERHPQVTLFTDALAYTLARLGSGDEAVAILSTALNDTAPSVRVMAAKTMLTETFIHLLDGPQIEAALNVTRSDADVWEQLAVYSAPTQTRERAALLLSVARSDVAAEWLSQLPAIEVIPEDIVAQAMIALSGGDVEQALASLRPAMDKDWFAAASHMYPDRWQNNAAAQTYSLLLGDIAVREGRYSGAIRDYQTAIENGSIWAGRYFLAQAYEANGQSAAAQTLRDELDAEWSAQHDTPLPEWVSLLTLADERTLYVIEPQIMQDDDAHRLTLTAIFGSGHSRALSVEYWRIQLVSPDATTQYAAVDTPAVFVDGALTQATITLDLPPDVPALTASKLFIEPRYGNAVTYTPVVRDVVLNRPPAAQQNPDAQTLDLQFGAEITLDSYYAEVRDDALQLTLYWQAQSVPDEDYQVFVHVVDSAGEIVAQDDGSPVDNRYPMSQWRAQTLIEDQHVLSLDGLPFGESYRVRVGMYRSADVMRLAITPTNANVDDNSVWLYTFDR